MHRYLSLVIGMALFLPGPALAEDFSGPDSVFNIPAQSAQNGRLSGGVRLNNMRIQRAAPLPAYGSEFARPDNFQSAVSTQDYMGGVSISPPPQQPQPPKGKYIWGLSRDGGYYDASGQIKTVIPGDQLYKYGGTFMDGQSVPTSPVVTNFAGHAYRFPYVIRKGN